MKRALLLLAACADSGQGTVTVTGTVRPAASVDVVFRAGAREEIARSRPDGTYRLALPAGTYRVFVRDESMMSVGRMDRPRLPGLPIAPAAGAFDEALAPQIRVAEDLDAVDVEVVRSGLVTGTIFDVDGRPVFGAVVSAHRAPPAPRPVLGTDVVVSRYDGSFEMRLPDGDYQLAATHAAYADAVEIAGVELRGGTQHVSLTLVKGCVITGRVLGADGKPAGDGAIEKRFGATDLEFVPNGRSNSDGTFRWTTTDEIDVVLRAWPWHSPPSPSKRFACRDGAVFDKVVFKLADRAPDLAGQLDDRDGAPVRFAHLDIQPLDPGGIAQQERTDAHGRWAVYALPPGRYAITAHAPGGVVAETVTSPATGVQLKLSGTGRLEGTTTAMQHGSFDLALDSCLLGPHVLRLQRDPRLVPVINGRFAVHDLPACELQLVAIHLGESTNPRITVPAGGTARLQLDLGVPRAKTVTGVVRDRDNDRVRGAYVTATYRKQTSTALTDEDGHFTIDTFGGATISADRDGARGEAHVGLANVPRERVEITILRR